MKKRSLLFFIYFVIINSFFITNIYADGTPTASDIFGSNTPDYSVSSDDGLESKAVASGNEAGKIAGSAELKNISDLNLKLDEFFKYIRWGISFLTTLGTISSFLVLSMAFVRLANAPDNSFQRRNCYIDILKGGLCVICFGGLTLLMTVFYKTFSVFIQNTIMLSNDWKRAFAFALVEFKYLICGACGLLSLTMLVLFIKDIIEFGSSGGNPQRRAEAMKKILITGIATVGIGGVGVFVAIFNGLLA